MNDVLEELRTTPRNGGESRNKQVFFSQDPAMATTTGAILHTNSSEQKRTGGADSEELVDLAFFKFCRVGQIRLELTLSSIPWLPNITSNGFCTPTVLHRELWSWYKAFKYMQNTETRKLLASSLKDKVTNLNSSSAATAAASTVPAMAIKDIADEAQDDQADVRLEDDAEPLGPMHATSGQGTSWLRKRSSLAMSTAATFGKKTDAASGAAVRSKKDALVVSAGGDELPVPAGAGETDSANYERLFGKHRY